MAFANPFIMLCNMKICIKCNLKKDLSQFYRTIYAEDGRTEKCKYCLDGESIERYYIMQARTQYRSLKSRKCGGVNYSFEEFKEYMENMGMDWGSHGTDHKVPVIWFEKNTPKHLINDLQNLQPLNSTENQAKRDRFSDPISKDYYNKIIKWIIPQKKLNVYIL